MEFPFVSKVSIESQKLLMETPLMIKCRELAKVDLEKMQTLQDLKIKVLTEQEEFQKFVYKQAKSNHHLCNYIHPNGWDYFKTKTEEKQMELNAHYPQQYSLQETIGLAVGVVFKSDAVLTFEQTLEQVGNVPLLPLPASNGLLLSEDTSSLKQRLTTPTTETSKIRKKRVPCTFPAVLEKDLALMAQKEREAKAKKSKMNKKKGKKKYKGKAEEFTPRKRKPEHATQQSSDIADHGRKPQNIKSQKRKFHKRWQKGRRSALSANFFNTQPVEKESKVFSAARMASDPVTYDDIDF